MSLPPSKYLPIWNQLKSKKTCRITAPTVYHKTIIKMLKNKRDDDLGYRYQLAENGKTHRIGINVKGTVITFTLIESVTVNGL